MESKYIPEPMASAKGPEAGRVQGGAKRQREGGLGKECPGEMAGHGRRPGKRSWGPGSLSWCGVLQAL